MWHVITAVSAQGGEGEDASESVAVLAAASGDASWLAAALEAAGLSDELAEGFVGTVFVPTDEAFGKLAEQLGLSEEEVLADTELLAQVLPYHVVPGQALTAGDLEDGEILQTQLGGQAGELKYTEVNGNPHLGTTSGQRAKVVKADLQAGFAVVHLVDKVLVPGAEFFEGGDFSIAEAPAPAPEPVPEPSPSPPPSPVLSPPPPSPLPPRPPLPVVLCMHVVEAGEFLSSLAETYATTNDALLAINPQITKPDSIPLGSTINVPCKKA
ncbi:hypothetical protein CHLNCDRAFT_143442 [Chlorella variabilis]|uniref:FAS1 domain-containing protein n=1 Tax=Chlorella variabilis TaxID=554065 RepID=E1ZAX3_CHLVA|nr:hypothetical protein CHLNCDRAFT_143442 [Chlorella variabilis]EFN56924.1 hypothetical protein CHLNCDRAFT_143442 [Chlorella variabilis]|eukprot:XP_005849026.1 hypothetical protein CHLNCDRAFT_143442 [Chlorella variabilis]